MKEKSKFSMMILAALAFVTFATAYASDGIGVTINGAQVVFENQAPALVDGRTLVPVRGVFEALGFEVDWIDATRTVTLDREGFAVRITIDSAEFTTNGTSNTLDVPAQIIGYSTMLPIRAVLESVGYYLDWDSGTQTVLISTTPLEGIPSYVMFGGEWYSTSLTTELNFMHKGPSLTTEEFAQLRYMVNLTSLVWGLGRVYDLTPISGLTNLTVLQAIGGEGSGVTDLSSVSGLTNLTNLSLHGFEISDLTLIANLTNLRSLELPGNQISDISPLAGLANLEMLILGSNQITDISPLTGLTNLESLGFLDNQITDISPLAEIAERNPNLDWNWVNFSRNPIIDWSPVSHIETVWGRPDDWND